MARNLLVSWLLILICQILLRSTQGVEKQSLLFCENDFSDACHERTTSSSMVLLTGIKIPDLRVIQNLTRVNLTSSKTQYCTQGVWAEYSKPNYKGAWSIHTGSCTTSTTDRDYIGSLRYIGNADMSLPGISLYSGDGSAGHPVGNETYVDGTTPKVNFEHPLCVSYWALTSNQSWTIYSGQHWTGNSTCLTPHSFDYGLGQLDYIHIGSIRLGCHSNFTTENSKAHDLNFETCLVSTGSRLEGLALLMTLTYLLQYYRLF